MEEKTTLNPVQVIRAAASRRRAYYSAAIFNLHPVEKPGIVTMAVDKYWRLYYDPAIFDRWDLDKCTNVLIHEVLHCLFDHCKFAEENGWIPEIANFAFDLAINSWLRKDGIMLPDGCLYPEQFNFPDGLSKEEYYERLMKQAKDGQPKPGKGQGKGQGKGKGEDEADGQAQPGAGGCGSAAGNPGSWEDAAPADGGGPGIDNDLEKELVRRQVAAEVERAAGIGNIPGDLARWAKEVLNVDKTDWRMVLLAACRNAAASIRKGQADYSFRRVSRRGLAAGINLPGMIEADPRIAVVVDTSGSVGDDWLGVALNVINRVVQQIGCPVHVLSCDTRTGRAQRVTGRAARLGLEGGGGTDMGEGIRAAGEIFPKPNIIIVLTDLETPWPSERPKAQVIVVGPERSSYWSSVPAWARKIGVRQ